MRAIVPLMVPDLFRACRRKNLPATVTPGCRLYAIGDIHGRADLLVRLHEMILADAESAKGVERFLAVYIGDYIDRGLQSREVIDMLLDEPLRGFETVHLKGNHEDMLLRFLEKPAAGPIWLANGGDGTLLSYGVGISTPVRGAEMLGEVRQRLSDAIPVRHLEFLKSLRLSYKIGDYMLVHAGIRPGRPVDEQDPRDLLWIREDFTASGEDHGKVIVHGHSVNYRPEERANRIGIDTGAFATGRLTALVLEEADRRFIQTGAGEPAA